MTQVAHGMPVQMTEECSKLIQAHFLTTRKLVSGWTYAVLLLSCKDYGQCG